MHGNTTLRLLVDIALAERPSCSATPVCTELAVITPVNGHYYIGYVVLCPSLEYGSVVVNPSGYVGGLSQYPVSSQALIGQPVVFAGIPYAAVQFIGYRIFDPSRVYFPPVFPKSELVSATTLPNTSSMPGNVDCPARTFSVVVVYFDADGIEQTLRLVNAQLVNYNTFRTTNEGMFQGDYFNASLLRGHLTR